MHIRVYVQCIRLACLDALVNYYMKLSTARREMRKYIDAPFECLLLGIMKIFFAPLRVSIRFPSFHFMALKWEYSLNIHVPIDFACGCFSLAFIPAFSDSRRLQMQP